MIEEGHALPDAQVAFLNGKDLAVRNVRELVDEARCLIIGLPGAFTPVCTNDHLPGVANRLPQLKKAGISRFFVFVPDNPWAVREWAKTFPFKDEFEWFADGNHDFAKRCGLLDKGFSYFLGECTRRYAIQTDDVVVERIAVEKSHLHVDCTGGAAILDLAQRT